MKRFLIKHFNELGESVGVARKTLSTLQTREGSSRYLRQDFFDAAVSSHKWESLGDYG